MCGFSLSMHLTDAVILPTKLNAVKKLQETEVANEQNKHTTNRSKNINYRLSSAN